VNFCVHINECWLTENEYLDLLHTQVLARCPKLNNGEYQTNTIYISRILGQLALITSSIDTVKHCQEYFGFDLPSVLWAKRMQMFEVKFGLYLSSE